MRGRPQALLGLFAELGAGTHGARLLPDCMVLIMRRLWPDADLAASSSRAMPLPPSRPLRHARCDPTLADNKQQALYSEYAQAQSQRKIGRTQDQCRKKLQARAGAAAGRGAWWAGCPHVSLWLAAHADPQRPACLHPWTSQEVHNGYLSELVSEGP